MNPGRPLLPRPHEPENPSEVLSPPQQEQQQQQQQPTQPSARVKRQHVTAACENCRRRKAKCDGARPRCSPCAASGRHCEYRPESAATRLSNLKRTHHQTEHQLQELSASHAAFHELFQALRFRDEADASVILQRIRQDIDVASLLEDIRAGDQLLQLPEMVGSASSREATGVPKPPFQLVASSGESSKSLSSIGEPGNSSETSSERQRQEVQEPYIELFELFKAIPERGVLEIIRRARQGADVTEALRLAKDGDLLAQLSLVPETRRRYELPFCADFPPYLCNRDIPYLDTLVYETKLGVSAPPDQWAITRDSASDSGSRRSLSTTSRTPYLIPYHAAELVEPRLSRVRCRDWTSVIHDDNLLRHLLSLYFMHQDPVFYPFQKDYFLDDMVAGQPRFCSPLLVNAVLAAACHMHLGIKDRAQFWSPDNLAHRFLTEAKRIWGLQEEANHLTAIQAAIIISIVCDMDGMDKLGRLYMLQAVAMAHNAKLFSDTPDGDGEGMRRARTFTSWSLLAWDSVSSFYFFRAPLLDKLPETPLPDPAKDPEWYGEVWVLYPLSNVPTPTHSGLVTRALLEIRIIMHDMALASRGRGSLPPGQAREFRGRLGAWFNRLPEPLTYQNISLPSHYRLHMEYYSLVIALCRFSTGPDVDALPAGGGAHIAADGFVQGRATGVASAGRTNARSAEDVLVEAKAAIETLGRLYYIRHSFAAYDAFANHFFVLLANLALGAMEKGTRIGADACDVEGYRSTLLLCAVGIHAQGKHSYLMRQVSSLIQNRIPKRERNMLFTCVEEGDTGEEYGWFGNKGGSGSDSGSGNSGNRGKNDAIAEYDQSHSPLPIVGIDEGPGWEMASTLVREYERLSLDGQGGNSE